MHRDPRTHYNIYLAIVIKEIRIYAIMDRQSFEELGQIVQIHLRQLLRAFLVVHVLDVYASVGNESL
jgi:hypothetical protein